MSRESENPQRSLLSSLWLKVMGQEVGKCLRQYKKGAEVNSVVVTPNVVATWFELPLGPLIYILVPTVVVTGETG